MRYCKHCGVHLRGAAQKCPLCQGPLVGEGNPKDAAFPVVPEKPSRRLLAWAAFISIAAAAICVTINLILPVGGWWSFFVLAGIASLWISLILIIKKRGNIPKGILWQVAVISLLAWLWDFFTGHRGWALDYVIPILCSCALVAMAVVARIRRLHIHDYILYLIMDSILGMVFFVLLLVDAVNVPIPSAICFGTSVLFFAALLFFEGKALFAEIQRRLHV